MREVKCMNCGANEWLDKNGFRVCAYCGTKFQLEAEDVSFRKSKIALNSDVERLLEKCRKNPSRARRFANLILDIDPSNEEARKYL